MHHNFPGTFRCKYAYLSEKAMATHSSTFAWKIPWTEEPARLQSMGSLRVRHDWATSLSLFTFTHWRRKWQPTPVFLPGESQGRGSLVGCLWGHTESGHDWSDLAAACLFVYWVTLIPDHHGLNPWGKEWHMHHTPKPQITACVECSSFLSQGANPPLWTIWAPGSSNHFFWSQAYGPRTCSHSTEG